MPTNNLGVYYGPNGALAALNTVPVYYSLRRKGEEYFTDDTNVLADWINVLEASVYGTSTVNFIYREDGELPTTCEAIGRLLLVQNTSLDGASWTRTELASVTRVANPLPVFDATAFSLDRSAAALPHYIQQAATKLTGTQEIRIQAYMKVGSDQTIQPALYCANGAENIELKIDFVGVLTVTKTAGVTVIVQDVIPADNEYFFVYCRFTFPAGVGGVTFRCTASPDAGGPDLAGYGPKFFCPSISGGTQAW
jgi:hypothetical protein